MNTHCYCGAAYLRLGRRIAIRGTLYSDDDDLDSVQVQVLGRNTQNDIVMCTFDARRCKDCPLGGFKQQKNGEGRRTASTVVRISDKSGGLKECKVVS